MYARALLLMAAAMAASAVATMGAPVVVSAGVSPFPAPNIPMGAFHTLPFLRCETSRPHMEGGRRGFRYQLPEKGIDTSIAIGLNTCTGPLPDTSTLESGLVVREDNKTVPGAAALRKHRAADLVTADLVRGRYAQNTQYYPLPPEGRGPTDALFAGAQLGLVHEPAIGRALGLQRNTYAGAAHRMTRNYDVLAVSRLTAGVCRKSHCFDLSAVDILGGGKVNFGHTGVNDNPTPGKAALLTVPAVDGGRAAVSVMDSALLSLGYRALVDPLWLTRMPGSPWNPTSEVIFMSPVSSQGTVPINLRHKVYRLSNRRSGSGDSSSRWLQSMAFVLCQPPARSFVTNPDVLCAGVRPARSDGTQVASDVPERARDRRATILSDAPPPRTGIVNNKAVPSPARSLRQLGFRWDLDPGPIGPPQPLESCVGLRDADAAARPPWLAAVGPREINPDSADEVALARSMKSCLYESGPKGGISLYTRFFSFGTPPQDFGQVTDLLSEMAQTYSGVFGGNPPPEPSGVAPVLLAIIVVIPEALALVAMTLDERRRWSRRTSTTFGLVWAAGLVSLSGIIYLAWQEADGAAWRAAM